MTENVRKVFDILGVEPYEKFMIENSIYTYEITKNLFVIYSDDVSFIRDKDNNDNFLTNLLNGTYKIIKLPKKKHVGDLICKDLNCINCPLHPINCNAGDVYSNLYKNLEFHYELFKDKEIYDLFKKQLDEEIDE